MIKLYRHNMKIVMSASGCKPAPSFLKFQGGIKLDPSYQRKDKVVFVMGATGTGKSKLAIDLAKRYSGEVINSDKMQVYKGLNIVTNKVTEEECQGIHHHLLGFVEPDSDFESNDFCHHTSMALESIIGRYRLPIIAGGSNSFIDALVNGDPEFLRTFECCFLWVNVQKHVLNASLSKRVDKMVAAGLVDEVRRFFDPTKDNTRGIRRAIGYGELEQFLQTEAAANDETKARSLEAAIEKIKENNIVLASRQIQKIHRLNRLWNWRMHQVDATQVFLKRGKEADEAWKRHVTGPSTRIVENFLFSNRQHHPISTILSPEVPTAAASIITTPLPLQPIRSRKECKILSSHTA